jgi:hypothetical protein
VAHCRYEDTYIISSSADAADRYVPLCHSNLPHLMLCVVLGRSLCRLHCSSSPNTMHLHTLRAGSINTIATKFQDNVVIGVDSTGKALHFKHPAFQTACMFAGEALCLIPFVLGRWFKHLGGEPVTAQQREHYANTVWAFILPALCDSGATTLLNLGLFYT